MVRTPLHSAQERRQTALAGRFRSVNAAFLLGAIVALSSGLFALRAACSTTEPIAVERINPNSAPAASLMRLPGIGRVRAMDIVDFRQAQPPNRPAFQSADDLQNIRGIGPVTAEKIAPYLVFDE